LAASEPALDQALPAKWSMGLLGAGDWKAQWIGYDRHAITPPTTPISSGL